MKLSELINQLNTLWFEHGDIDVSVDYGCGCCVWTDEPNVRVINGEVNLN